MGWLHSDYFFLTLPFILLAMLFIMFATWQRGRILQRLGNKDLIRRLAASVCHRRRRWKAALFVLGLLLCSIALSGPQVGTKLREVKREGVDMIIALDVSLSMQAEDVAPNRLERAKNEIKKLLTELRGDRVGLVIFAGDAFLQCPLTTDYSAVRLFLDVADGNLLPTPGTDFDAALTQAIQAFNAPAEMTEEAPTRVMLIVSDGENHVEDLDTILARAQEERIVIFSAGVGDKQGAPIPVTQMGRTVYQKDAEGNIVHTRLEEKKLKMLASDGAYFEIGRTSSSLGQIIPALERLDKGDFGVEEFEEYDNKYQWPLVAAWLILFVEIFLRDRRKKEMSALYTIS